MKKILLAVTAALAITGCSQNEEFDYPSQKAEINFSTAAVTRATAMITDNFKQFKVYGYAHTGGFTTETESKTLVEGIFNKSEDKKWSEKDSNKFYWPSEGNVTFFGYSPVAETGTTYTAPESSKGYPTIVYTVNDDIASQSDFLVADKTGNGTTNVDGISLGFKHALTQIAFKLKGSDSNVNYTVTKLVLKGINNVGTYKWGTNTWESTTGTKDYTIDMVSSAATFVGDGADAVELTGNDKVLMLIPQAPNSAKIEVTYTATDKTTNIVYNNAPKEVNVPTDQWEVSQRIVFTIALTPGKIMNISGEVVNNGWADKEPQPDDLK